MLYLLLACSHPCSCFCVLPCTCWWLHACVQSFLAFFPPSLAGREYSSACLETSHGDFMYPLSPKMLETWSVKGGRGCLSSREVRGIRSTRKTREGWRGFGREEKRNFTLPSSSLFLTVLAGNLEQMVHLKYTACPCPDNRPSRILS